MDDNYTIQQAYMGHLVNALPKLDERASKVIKSFQDFVDEIIKVEKLSAGTPMKQPIKQLANELNNSSVYFAKMISEELGKIYGVVNANDTTKLENDSEAS